MSTARVIHPTQDNVPAQQITISNSGVASPNACIIATLQQVTFTNNSGGMVNIMFVPDALNPTVPVFNNVMNLSPVAPNNVITLTPLVPNRTTNYNVVIGANTYGPYAIQVGNGPLYITVKSSFTAPDPAVIPMGGTVEMVATDSSNYSVNWPNTGDPFNPPLTSVGIGLANNSPHTNNAGIYRDYPYTIVANGPTLGNGGGTIKVKGT